MNLLLTAGATREPIDEVRYLSNVSTGATGAALAAALVALGHRVTLLHGTGATLPDAGVADLERFSSAADLHARLARRLGAGTYDAVIMAAAVADYRPEAPAAGKLSSAAPALTLTLVRNPKLLPGLKALAPRPLVVVGFKLTVDADASARLSAVAAQFTAGGVECVVHNDLAEINAAGRAAHPFRVYTAATVEPRNVAGVPALAAALFPH
jgi:phosphopantothenoylcysteine decarboxylase/phosphopantothenate--cysteine ligase